MTTGPGGFPPPPSRPPGTPPPPPPPPPHLGPPRWSWWVGGIAIPLAGILATLIVSNDPGPAAAPAPAPAPASSSARTGPTGSKSPDHASAESASPRATPDASPSPSVSSSSDADLTAPAGYAEAVRAMWGLAPAPCNQNEQQLVDLDDGSSRVEPAGRGEDNGAAKDPRGAELLYWPLRCWDSDNYRVRALPNTRVGLLQADMPKSFDSCKAASATGFGALGLLDSYERRKRGFVEGAALCSVTDRGAVSMALIEHIDDGSDEASVSGTLYVWPKSP
ncbi:hypothetical protein [Streptomyces sp. NPDC001743]|uniref:hypothetical protein n=1 Tax=Streptomyces sp. NPDC001743 TaxID=3154397 RepID=UPI00332BD802